jgi:hypothetical protein
MNGFICTRFRLFPSSRSKGRSIILLITTGYRCWYCEQELPAGFCGVHAAAQTRRRDQTQRLLFITCGERCQQGVLNECEENGVPAQLWTGPEVRALLDHDEDIAGVSEMISFDALRFRYGTGRLQ